MTLEQFKDTDYEYLFVYSTLEDIEDRFTRERSLELFDNLIKRLYDSNR